MTSFFFPGNKFYLSLSQITVRESKFGQVLVIETTEQSGAYILGFRIDPLGRLKQIMQEIMYLYTTQIRNPDLGVEWSRPPINVIGKSSGFQQIINKCILQNAHF